MSTVEVILDARKLLGFHDIPNYAEAALEDVMGTYISRMKRRAKILHRFRSRTGNLVSAIESELYGLSGRVYIDDMVAPYGKFVHNGQRSWAPDPFVYDAVSELEDELSTALKQTLEASIQKAQTDPENRPEAVIDKKIEKELQDTIDTIIKNVPEETIEQVLDSALKDATAQTIINALETKKLSSASKIVAKTAAKEKSYNDLALLFAILVNEEDAALAKAEQDKKIRQEKLQEMYR